MDEINNETLGMTAEKVICDLVGLDCSKITHRSNVQLEDALRPTIKSALGKLPRIKSHVGQNRGSRGGQSKSNIDFVCEGGKTLSIKTTKQSWKLCPSECGQPGADTFDQYFGHLYEGKIDYDKAKKLVLEKIHLMFPIYLQNLFDNDYMLFIFHMPKETGHWIFEKSKIPTFRWGKEKFSFSKNYENWNESCTIKYDGVTVAEFQLHQHRNNYKFRFDVWGLAKTLGFEVTGAPDSVKFQGF